MHRLVFGISLAAAVASQVVAQTLDGWPPFKFGMAPDQARALPGQSFGRYAIDEANNGAMGSKKSELLNGVPFGFYLFFNAFKSLNRIALQNEKTTNQADCEAAYLVLLAQLEKTYGKLSPVYPERQKNAQDILPISIAWKKTAGTSRYQLATVLLGTETAYVWDARKLYGKRYFDLAAVWSAASRDDKAVCLTELDFQA